MLAFFRCHCLADAYERFDAVGAVFDEIVGKLDFSWFEDEYLSGSAKGEVSALVHFVDGVSFPSPFDRGNAEGTDFDDGDAAELRSPQNRPRAFVLGEYADAHLEGDWID